MKDRKLILLTGDYPYGKGETFLENEIHFLASEFSEVLIISSSLSSQKTRDTPSNVKSILFRSKNSNFKFSSFLSGPFLKEFGRNMLSNPLKNKITLKSWAIASELAEIIKSKTTSSTILYSYWLDFKALALSILKHQDKTLKVVSKAHRWDIYEEEHLYQYLPFTHFMFDSLDCIYSISEDGKTYLESKGAKKVNLSRLGTIQNDSISTEFQGGVLHLISISYAIKRKRLSVLVDAIHQIDKPEIKIKWTHFGDGPELENLKQQITDIKHIPIDFKGFVKNSELIKWIKENAASCLLINLSESEGIPVSMMEAMSFGIPCIGTDVGGVSEIIENLHNGYLLSSNPKAKEVAEVLASFYSLSSGEKNEMKKNALNTWKSNYNADQNFKDFCASLQAL